MGFLWVLGQSDTWYAYHTIFLVYHANDYVGDVWWLDEADAMSQGLAYINGANNAIIKVDNTSNVEMNNKRNSVRVLAFMSIKVF
jgi:hypothetical protein